MLSVIKIFLKKRSEDWGFIKCNNHNKARQMQNNYNKRSSNDCLVQQAYKKELIKKKKHRYGECQKRMLTWRAPLSQEEVATHICVDQMIAHA